MGCDIHAHTEVKIKGVWEHYSVLNLDRNYKLFTLLAGVRNDGGEVLSKPRGLPDDITMITKIDSDRWGEDGHSHSYITAEEFKKVEQFIRDKDNHSYPPPCGYLFGHYWGRFVAHPEDMPDGIEDVRMVFWFDN